MKIKLNKDLLLFALLIALVVIYGRMEQASYLEEIEWKRNLKETVENEQF